MQGFTVIPDILLALAKYCGADWLACVNKGVLLIRNKWRLQEFEQELPTEENTWQTKVGYDNNTKMKAICVALDRIEWLVSLYRNEHGVCASTAW